MHCIFLRPTNLAGRQQPASTDSSRHRAAFQASQLHYPTSNRSLGADSIFTLRAKPPSHLVAHVADVAEHVLDKGQRRVTRAEGGHDLASIWLHAHRIESWHLKALGRRNQAEDANHREATVVDFRQERLLLTLRRHLRGEAKRIPQVERHGVRELALQRGEIARLATTHVVLLAIHLENRARLRPHLKEANRWDVCEGTSHWALQVPWEVDAVRLHAVADERSHRHAAVLDLRMAKPADRLGHRVLIDDVKRVPEANDRVELLSECDHASPH